MYMTHTYMTDKHDDLFLTVHSLITLNDFITGSCYIGLRDINVKPTDYNKIYMHKCLVEPALYCLIDQFNDRRLSHKEFCAIFLEIFILFEMEMVDHAKSYLLSK